MRVEVNGMFYEEGHPDCKRILAPLGSKLFAFVQCVDTGSTGKCNMIRRYWGEFSWDDEAGSLKHIMEWGGKWPRLPEAPERLED